MTWLAPHSAAPMIWALTLSGLIASPMSIAMVSLLTRYLPVAGSTVTSATPATQVGLWRSSADETARPSAVLGGSLREPQPALPAATRRQFAKRNAPPTVPDSYGIHVPSFGQGNEIHSWSM